MLPREASDLKAERISLVTRYDKPKIAVVSGPNATILNSPALVTSNKGRLPGERMLPGRYDHLVPQNLYEPVVVRIRKYTAHPLERDSGSVYVDDGTDYHEVELLPEDGPYLLPYMARRSDGSGEGVPFEDEDLLDPSIEYGQRQFFYPDASRVFDEINRTIGGRDENGRGNLLDGKADFDFLRILPSGGFSQDGEIRGSDYFPYKPFPLTSRRPRRSDLATVVNGLHAALDREEYAGILWLECSSTIEETLYWLNLLLDTQLPVAGCASQRPHGQLSNDGDRNIVDAVDYLLSGRAADMGVVGIQDEQIFAAREFKKADDRPGGYKASGGHGGILGTIGPPVTLWYKPTYRHTSTSQMRLTNLPEYVHFQDFADSIDSVKVRIKRSNGSLLPEAIPRVTLVKSGAYMDEGDAADPATEVDMMARISQALNERASPRDDLPRLHGMVIEGDAPYGIVSGNQAAAMRLAVFSGIPVVRVARSDPGGRVPLLPIGPSILGSNLDANKARLLLTAAMLKLGGLPRARDPRNPTEFERESLGAKLEEYQKIFEAH
ncbi:MAG: asparaginase domain-containing protein [bacterium]